MFPAGAIKEDSPAGTKHSAKVLSYFPNDQRSPAMKLQLTILRDTLKGKGSKTTAGTQITLIRVPPPVAAKGGYGLRVRASGHFSGLHVSSGSLFLYVAASMH